MLCPGQAVAGAHLVPVPLVVDSSEDQDVQDQEAVMMMIVIMMMLMMMMMMMMNLVPMAMVTLRAVL